MNALDRPLAIDACPRQQAARPDSGSRLHAVHGLMRRFKAIDGHLAVEATLEFQWSIGAGFVLGCRALDQLAALLERKPLPVAMNRGDCQWHQFLV